MTCIAYRDGIMASDSARFDSDTIVSLTSKKIHRMPNGGLVGCAGLVSDIDAFVAWKVDGQEQPRDLKDIVALVVEPDGRILVYTENLRPVNDISDFPVIGAGGDLMRGAMAQGASAVEAVQIAIHYSAWCGGEVQFEELRIEMPRRPKRFYWRQDCAKAMRRVAS